MLRLRHLRDTSDPFDVTESAFISIYRLPKAAVQSILEIFTNAEYIEHTSRRIPMHLRSLCALHFYAHGSYQKPTGQNHGFAMSQAAVSRCVKEITALIKKHLMHQYIKFPTSNMPHIVSGKF